MEYPKFTAEMRKTHKILIPSMLDLHMQLFANALRGCGYNVEVLKNDGPSVVEEGLKYVHNDTCYPALLVIGQFIDALNNRDDVNNVALIITQTGGGCRASNYIHLLRKALIKAGYPQVPVISLNASNLEPDSGLKLNLELIKKISAAMTYGDFLMYLKNKCQAYEIIKGETSDLTNSWLEKISLEIDNNKGLSFKELKKNLNLIAKDYDNIKLDLSKEKPKVGIVGEIYIKYAALGNNHLEEFLHNEGAEIMVPGLYGFILYTLYNSIYDHEIYGDSIKKKIIAKLVIKYLYRREKIMIEAIKKTKITPMQYFKHTKEMANGILSKGTKMGEGWLLTAEMVELIKIGYNNIICAQPFGCLPNHVCGKGVMKTIKELYPNANIVAIDYDPSATKVNQENRIKLMLAIAKENLNNN